MSSFYPPAAKLHPWCINSYDFCLHQENWVCTFWGQTFIQEDGTALGEKIIPSYKRSIGQVDFPSSSKCYICEHGIVNSEVSKGEMAPPLNSRPLADSLASPPGAGAFSPSCSQLSNHLPGDASENCSSPITFYPLAPLPFILLILLITVSCYIFICLFVHCLLPSTGRWDLYENLFLFLPFSPETSILNSIPCVSFRTPPTSQWYAGFGDGIKDK